MKYAKTLKSNQDVLVIVTALGAEKIQTVQNHKIKILSIAESLQAEQVFFKLAWHKMGGKLWISLDYSAWQGDCQNVQLLKLMDFKAANYPETEQETIKRMIGKAKQYLFAIPQGQYIDLTATRAAIDSANGFDISESSGGVHKHSQGDLYPIIMFSKGINAERQFYLYGSHVIHKESVTNQQIADFVEILRGNNHAEKIKVVNWFVKNGYPYGSDY